MSTRRNIPQRKQTVRPAQGANDGISDEIVNIVEVKEHAQDFYVKHQKLILSVVTGLVLLIGGYLAYKYAYVEPKEKAAIEAMYQAEAQFARDSFASALDNREVEPKVLHPLPKTMEEPKQEIPPSYMLVSAS